MELKEAKECGCPVEYDLIFAGDRRLGMLLKDFSAQTTVKGYSFQGPFMVVEPSGMVTACRGFIWDFGSGPAIDTPDVVRASIVHDIFCALVKTGKLPREVRAKADKDYYLTIKALGMNPIRALWQYAAVRLEGIWSA